MSHHDCVPDESVADPVERLKAQADCFWYEGRIDLAYKVGEAIIELGRKNGSFSQQGLGYMVCGDALHDQHRFPEAWDKLEKAAEKYRLAAQAGEADADYNRARTVIGKLFAAVGRDKIAQVKREFAEAVTIFSQSSHPEAPAKLASLYHNAGHLFSRIGEYDEARDACHHVLELIKAGKASLRHLEPSVYLLLGQTHGHRGESRQSAEYFEKALALFEMDPPIPNGVLIAHQNLAISEFHRGLYQESIDRLEKHILLKTDSSNLINFGARRSKLECFLAMSNFEGAVELANELTEILAAQDDKIEPTEGCGPALSFLAIAQAELGNYQEAEVNFQKALKIFDDGQVTPEARIIKLRNAQVQLRRHEYAQARDTAQEILNYFIETGHSVQEADTRLILARIAFHEGQPAAAIIPECEKILDIAETSSSFQHRYAGQLLLGDVARRDSDFDQAEQHYKAALDTVNQAHQNLSSTYRPAFLSDKGEALRALVCLYLESGRPDRAFDIIEHCRVQVFQRYLITHSAPPSAEDDTDPRLWEKFSELQQDFLSFSNAASSSVSMDADPQVTAERQKEIRQEAREKARITGRKLEELTQHLLNRAVNQQTENLLNGLSAAQLQQVIGDQQHIIAYFDDGTQVMGFAITGKDIFQCTLIQTAELRQLIKTLDDQITRGLGTLRLVRKADHRRSGDDLLRLPIFNHPTLRRSFERAAMQLYNVLIRPFEPWLYSGENGQSLPLIVIPYGVLHSVPFHLLYDSVRSEFLIDTREVITLPTASLITRQKAQYPNDIVIVYDDMSGLFRHSAKDAARISAMLAAQHPNSNVRVYTAREALDKGVLHKSSGQILHIIAHALFDNERPGLSFMQLDGQPITMTDLLGRELRYRLVVLTACETGYGKVIERQGRNLLGDDLVGIGRAFLYAGARSIVASRWSIGDGITLPIMERFYTALQGGSTFAAALRHAQRDLTHPDGGIPTLHPVFSGVFQFIGENGRLEAFN